MNNFKTIRTYDDQGLRHGYWHVEFKSGRLWYIQNYFHGRSVGYRRTKNIVDDKETEYFYLWN